MQPERLVPNQENGIIIRTVEICKTKQNLASREKVSRYQRFHSRQVVNRESTKTVVFYNAYPNVRLISCQEL